jgi:hypothetical protein
MQRVRSFKIFSRTTRPKKLKFTWQVPDIVGIHVCSGGGWGHNRENLFYMCLCRKNIFKILIPFNNHWPRKAEIYMKALWHSTKISFLKRWSLGVGWGHNRENCFYMCLYRKNIFQIFFSTTTGPENLKFTWKLSDIVQKQVSKNHGPCMRVGWGHNRGNYFCGCLCWEHI